MHLSHPTSICVTISHLAVCLYDLRTEPITKGRAMDEHHQAAFAVWARKTMAWRIVILAFDQTLVYHL